MTDKSQILLTGATGYAGGSVLERLIHHPDAGNFDITILVRSSEKAKKFSEFGLNTVVGSFCDGKLLEELTAASDIVFNVADSDNVEVAKATLSGFKKRFQATGNPPIYIHTSGTAIITDLNAGGLYTSDVVWDDSNVDQLDTIPASALHRNVDLEVMQADNEGYVRAYLVTPGTIYGIASGKFVDAGLVNKHPIQIPALIKASLHRGQAGVIGKGLNSWPNVHIDEVADLYIDLFNAIRSNPDTVGHGRHGYYFALNDEHNLGDVSKELGRVLLALGKSTTDEPKPFTKEEIDQYFNGMDFFGSDCRGLANKAKAIGWKPKKTTKDLLASIKPEVEAILEAK